MLIGRVACSSAPVVHCGVATERSTVMKGIAKSRRGSPAIGLQTLIDKAVGKGRPGIKTSEVSDEEALEAAQLLSKKKSPFRHLDAGAVSGALSPAIQAVGRGTQALVNAKKGRLGAARRAITDTTKGEVAKNVMQGTLLGAGIGMGRETAATARARDTVDDFLKQNRTKASGLVRILGRLRSQGFEPQQLKDLEREAQTYADPVVRPVRDRIEGEKKTKEAAMALVELCKAAFASPRSQAPSVPTPPTPKSSLSERAGNTAMKAGRFKGMASSTSLKPPGPAASKIAINPRRNITQAINAFKN